MTFTRDDGLAFLTGQLEYIEPKLYETKYRGIKYQDLIPVSHEAGPAAESITYETMDSRAKARFLGTKAGDVPMVDIGIDRTSSLVHEGGLGYDYSLHELEVAKALNRPLDVRRASAVQRGVEEFAQTVAFTGDAARGKTGLLNDAGVTITTFPNGAGGTPDWDANKTPDEILADANGLLTGAWSASATVELLDTLLVPPTQYGYLATTRLSIYNETTLLEYLSKNNVFTTETNTPLTIKSLGELVNAGAGGAIDRCIAYRRDPEVLTFHYPMPLQFLPPQALGLGFVVNGHFRIGGTEIRYPGALAYGDDC